MSVEETLLIEKELKEDAEAVAEGITEHLGSKAQVVSFALFLIDHRTGTVQYISDVDRMQMVQMLKFWLKSQEN